MCSDLLARLGLKAGFLAQLFVASGLRYSGPGPAFVACLALASHGLQAMALYVFGLTGLQATACMSEQVLVDKFSCTLDKVTTLYHVVLDIGIYDR